MAARIKEILGWRRSSLALLGGFLLTILVIAYFWWPLAAEYLAYIDWDGAWWWYIDWLLIGIFLFMTLAVMTHANLRTDAVIILVGAAGGLVIESWGTQTNLWFYYTAERPPPWIIPAWPIASLTIDRITRLLNYGLQKASLGRFDTAFRTAYILTCAGFFILMVSFVWPTLGQSMTLFSLGLCVLLFLSERDHRMAFLSFAAGAGLGYFLELWGTTRACWTYYTFQMPPLFAVLAHGMAAVAFWRANRVTGMLFRRINREILSHLEVK
jgi:hypothetical protein